jgi:glycosyltransferase involved in cell wall biosynthesis
MKLISITIPAYNEQENLPTLFERLNLVLQSLKESYHFECIILDNGSSDRTPEIARDLCAHDTRWKYVRYSRNFGSEASLLAGLDFANGEAVINLFSDLQDPPELIPSLLESYEKGYDVVYGVVRERNDDSWLKSLGARVAYWLIYRLTECKIPPNATDFRLLSRKVYMHLRELREADRYMRGLTHWVGFKKTGVEFDRAPRLKGESAANLIYCVYFTLNAIVSFSARPLRWVMIFGAVVTFLSLILALTYILLYCFPVAFLPIPSPGITTAVILILFGLGLNSLFVGIIGEYTGRIYGQGKQRPIYIVDDKIGW